MRGHSGRTVRVGAVLLALAGACQSPAAGPPLAIGAFNFGESRVVAEVYAQALREHGVPTTSIHQLAGREGTFPALESGEIDLLPEYNGNALDFITVDEIMLTDAQAITSELRRALEPRGLIVLESSPAENRDELVVTQATADRYGLRTVSDLEPVAGQLTVGGPIEFAERNTGLRGLRAVYGIEFGEVVRTDAGGPRTAAALEEGRIDVARLFSTDPLIEERGWVVLVEDRPFALPNRITPIVREAVLTEQIEDTINAVSAALSTEDLVEFNRRHMMQGDDPGVIARDFLTAEGLR